MLTGRVHKKVTVSTELFYIFYVKEIMSCRYLTFCMAIILANFPLSSLANPEALSNNKSRTPQVPKNLNSQGNEILPYKYIGNTFSNKFHRPWCPFSQVMNAKHANFFCFRYQAIDDGFTPCRYCLPPYTKSVHAVLLHASIN
jgi:hypothetical protein